MYGKDASFDVQKQLHYSFGVLSDEFDEIANIFRIDVRLNHIELE